MKLTAQNFNNNGIVTSMEHDGTALTLRYTTGESSIIFAPTTMFVRLLQAYSLDSQIDVLEDIRQTYA